MHCTNGLMRDQLLMLIFSVQVGVSGGMRHMLWQIILECFQYRTTFETTFFHTKMDMLCKWDFPRASVGLGAVEV